MFSKNEALLIVDYQKDFADPDGALYVSGGETIVSKINFLIDRFDTVIASKDWHPKEAKHFEKWPVHCVQNTKGAEFHDDLNSFKIQKVFLKGTDGNDAYSAFEATNGDLDSYLKSNGIDTLHLVGLALDYCVKETAVDAVKRGYKVFIVLDATMPVDRLKERQVLDELKSCGVKFITQKEIELKEKYGVEFYPEELISKIVDWIKEKAMEANAKSLVLGTSGGIDSSVVAALVKDTGLKAEYLALDVVQSTPERVFDLEKALDIQIQRYDLTDVFKAYIRTVGSIALEDCDKGNKLADANLKSRIRMCVLYYVANLVDGLVVGTGNKSENLVGYFTKYGDGGVDILPIADLTKTEVKILAHYLGVPRSIIYAKPSAGLWDGQTDEDELGYTYDEIDRMIFTEQFDKKIGALIKRNQHKLKYPPKFEK